MKLEIETLKIQMKTVMAAILNKNGRKKLEFLFFKKTLPEVVRTIKGDLVSKFQLIMTIFEGDTF